MYAEVGCFAGVSQKDEYLENELGRETSIFHSNQRGLIRRGALPVHLPRSISKEFFYRGIWTSMPTKKGRSSQEWNHFPTLWDNITDLIQQKSRYQLATGTTSPKNQDVTHPFRSIIDVLLFAAMGPPGGWKWIVW